MSQGWVIWKLKRITQDPGSVPLPILYLQDNKYPYFSQYGHSVQASRLHAPKPEAESAMACVLCVFVKENFPGSASRLFLLIYHILPPTTWPHVYHETNH